MVLFAWFSQLTTSFSRGRQPILLTFRLIAGKDHNQHSVPVNDYPGVLLRLGPYHSQRKVEILRLPAYNQFRHRHDAALRNGRIIVRICNSHSIILRYFLHSVAKKHKLRTWNSGKNNNHCLVYIFLRRSFFGNHYKLSGTSYRQFDIRDK